MRINPAACSYSPARGRLRGSSRAAAGRCAVRMAVLCANDSFISRGEGWSCLRTYLMLLLHACQHLPVCAAHGPVRRKDLQMRSAPPPPPPSGAPAEKEPAARSVTGRVLSVLDAFAGEHRRLTLSDISRRTGMPLATTHRLVGELLSWGALERTRSGRYEIGLHLWAVAAMA